MTVFLDTVGLLAVSDESDQWRDGMFLDLLRSRADLVTSTFVLLECGNAAARRPPPTARPSADCASRWERGILSCQHWRIGAPRGWPSSVGWLITPALLTMSRSPSCGAWGSPRRFPTNRAAVGAGFDQYRVTSSS